jgi:hypothetical protein
MGNLLDHAKQELKYIGMDIDNSDEINLSMTKDILELVSVFSDQGHSGFSANYCINILEKILRFEPLSPLTGEDSEWVLLDYDPNMKFQNKRSSTVFKREDGTAYDIDAYVFWKWDVRDLGEDEEGYPGKSEPFKSYYTCSDSRADIEFPYTPTTQYIFVGDE